LYVNELTEQLKASGYGICIGSLFWGFFSMQMM